MIIYNDIIKAIRIILVIVTVFSVESVNIFANSDDVKGFTDMVENFEEEYIPKDVLKEEGYIVIDSIEAAEALKHDDYQTFIKERSEKLKEIPDELIEGYNLFLFEKLDIEQGNVEPDFEQLKNNIKRINNIDVQKNIKKLKKACNSQTIAAIDDDILVKQLEVLKNTKVEDMILSYFSANDYPISYGMFLHSLISNPKNLYYNIEGINAYKLDCGDMDLAHTFSYEFMLEKNFIKMIHDFAKADTCEENKDGFHYEFNRGDLKYSIHGTTNMRLHRKTSGKTYFRIWDVYDFAGTLAYLLDWTTTTNTYGVTIEGMYQWS